MGLYIVVNDNPPVDLTSATGWGYVIEWADRLDLERYGEIILLAEHGESSDLPTLAGQLAHALTHTPPRRAGTKAVLNAIYREIKDGQHEHEGYIIVSDGMNTDPGLVPDDEEDDEDYGDLTTDSIDTDGATFGRYTIRLVSPQELHNRSLSGEEFTDFAIHADMHDRIPANEIWLAGNQPPEEQAFLISTALYELRGLDKGLSPSDAYQRAVVYQKSLRQRAAAMQNQATIVGQEPERQASLYKQNLGVTQSPRATVWLVDEAALRSTLTDVDFVEGGNSAVYSFIPVAEIWVSSNVAEMERAAIALHEYAEAYIINDYGLDYPTAHYIAARIEWLWRHNRKQLKTSQLSGEFVDHQMEVIGGMA